ncbi:hypothetical protein LCGC14_2122870 [marine sediment metagenome]|uniref:Uncharacterized protein n=1 Tax=marine sediment metagenome TaxID=412755 RepID=A0A0F9GGT2_9ZZZZ
MGFNIDESPINRDWLHTEWSYPPYRSNAFFKKLGEVGTTLAQFKQSGMYKQALLDGAIVDDEWVPPSKRKKQ